MHLSNNLRQIMGLPLTEDQDNDVTPYDLFRRSKEVKAAAKRQAKNNKAAEPAPQKENNND